MIRIEMDGMCEGCRCADLELDYFFGMNNEKNWFIKCDHRDACDWMETRTINRLKGNGDADKERV